MHLSYYFLNHLTGELRQRLSGFMLAECYMQQRYECILAFHNTREEFFIKFNLYPEFTHLSFPEEFHKNKKGTYNLFQDLQGLKVLDIIQHENDRGFHVEFENGFALMFKLYGSRPNLLLFHEHSCIDMLNKNLSHDQDTDLRNVHKHTDQQYDTFAKTGGILNELFPAFDKNIIHKLNALGYEKAATSEEKWKTIEQLLSIFNQKKFFICRTPQGIVLSLFEQGKTLSMTSSAIEAANEFDKYYGHEFYFRKEKTEALTHLKQKANRAKNYIDKAEEKSRELSAQIRYDEVANIIMANLHQIPKNVESVILFNFYTEKEITIKLKKEITPQKNAENYYRKAKNQKIETERILLNIKEKKDEYADLLDHIKSVEEYEDLKTLRKYLKEHNLQEEKKEKVKEQESLFKRFEVEGFEILVGKNAKNNDLLTQKYSFKEDLWLHARDVAGSHVLIKYKAGKKIPKTVIEKAAQLAAWFSKRRNETLCPVIVTPKKYVRKSKGSPDGQVIVEREDVVMVKPQLI